MVASQRDDEVNRTINGLRDLTRSLNALDDRIRSRLRGEPDPTPLIPVEAAEVTESGSQFRQFMTPEGTILTLKEDGEVVSEPSPTSVSTSCIFCGQTVHEILGAACSDCTPSQGEVRPGIVYSWADAAGRAQWRRMLRQRAIRLAEIAKEDKAQHDPYQVREDWIVTHEM